MDVERLARKLVPLMPEQIRKWMRARDLADSELRGLIEKQIFATAHRVLGDFRSKLLLSLPPEARIKAEFDLGKVVYDEPKWPAGLARGELLQNLGVFGRSGSGKTNMVFHLLHQLSRADIPFVFLDWKRTARHLLPHLTISVNVFTPGRSLAPFAFNPFTAPPGMERQVYFRQVIDVLAEAYTLGDGARRMLEKGLAACAASEVGAITIDALLHAVEALPAREREHGWKITALRALESLAFAQVAPSDTGGQQELIGRMLNQSTIVELDALSQNSKKFFIPLLCLWLYRAKLAAPEREKLSLVIVVEEAHHVLYGEGQRSKESVMEMLLRQCREMGIGIIVVDQHPHLISSAALGNIYASLCLNQKEPKDIAKAAALSLVDEQDRHHFSKLPVGQAVVKLQDRWTEPFLIQIPQVSPTSEQKGAVTDAILLQYLANRGSDSRRNRILRHAAGQIPRFPLGDSLVDERVAAFLEDVHARPDDAVTARYQRLGLSPATGQRLKERLVRESWLEEAVIPIGNSRKVVLRLSKHAAEMKGSADSSSRRGSIVHEYWKRFHARRLEAAGCRVTLEATRHGGHVDVEAVNDSGRIAVEIETGKSDVVSNVRNCLRSGFSRVIVVATDEAALAIVERQLGAAGLFIPGRVDLILRDGESG